MTKEEIKQLEERVYAIGNSLFPIDVFFNDIRDNKDPKYNKNKAYEDLKLIIDEIYRLRDRAYENLKSIIDEIYRLRDKEKPKKVLKPEEVVDSWGYYCCPDCEKALYNPREDISWIGRKAKYCMECGRALDWGDDVE